MSNATEDKVIEVWENIGAFSDYTVIIKRSFQSIVTVEQWEWKQLWD